MCKLTTITKQQDVHPDYSVTTLLHALYFSVPLLGCRASCLCAQPLAACPNAAVPYSAAGPPILGELHDP